MQQWLAILALVILARHVDCPSMARGFKSRSPPYYFPLAQQIEVSQKSQVVKVCTSDRGVLSNQYDDLLDGHIDAFDGLLL